MKVIFLKFIAFTALFSPLAAQASDYYGAIAFSESTGRWGYSFDELRLEDATQSAINYCGVADCETKVWVRNGCAALATAPAGVYGWAWKLNRSAAENEAIYQCRLRSSACSLAVSLCTRGYSR